MLLRCFSSCLRIAGNDGIDYPLMLNRLNHILALIIIIYVTESHRELLHLLNHLNQRLIAATFNDVVVQLLIVFYHLIPIMVLNCKLVEP